MKKLSFILPVYNVEPYIEKCIRSIRDKDMPYKEYEIIVINDGSPDNSKEIVKNLQKEIPNILLINQENQGVSAARNKGIDNANGEYLVFIDPDDYVNPNLLRKLYDRVKRDNLDILQSGRSLVSSDGIVRHMVGNEDIKGKIFDGISAFYQKDKEFQFFDSSVGYLYKRCLINENNIKFPVGVVHLEDGVFIRKIFTLAKRVGFENCDFYQVFLRPGSASRSEVGTSLKAVEGDIISVKNLLLFKENHQLNSSQKELINTSILKYILLPLMRAISTKDIRALSNYNKLLRNENILPANINQVSANDYLKYAKSLNKSVWLFAIQYSYDLIIKKYKSKIV